MKFIKHNALIDICVNDIRKHIISPINLTVAIGDFVRYYIYGIP